MSFLSPISNSPIAPTSNYSNNQQLENAPPKQTGLLQQDSISNNQYSPHSYTAPDNHSNSTPLDPIAAKMNSLGDQQQTVDSRGEKPFMFRIADKLNAQTDKLNTRIDRYNAGTPLEPGSGKRTFMHRLADKMNAKTDQLNERRSLAGQTRLKSGSGKGTFMHKLAAKMNAKTDQLNERNNRLRMPVR